MRDAGDQPRELSELLGLVAGDLRLLRDAIGELPREEGDGLLGQALLRIMCYAAADGLREP